MITGGKVMKKVFFETEKDGFYGAYYENPRGSDCVVTVNEQNPQAVGFYEHMGFKTYKRTECDEEGKPYPILYMKI